MMRGFLVVSVFFLLYVSYYGAIHAAPLSSHHLQDSSLLYKWQQSESLPTYKRQTVNATAAPTPTVSAGETDIQIGFTGSAVRMAQKFGMLPSKERTVITVAQEDAADALILENASPYNVIQVEYVGSPSPFAVAFDVIVPDNEASSYLSQVKTNTSFQDDLRTSLNLPTSYSFHATQIASATPTHHGGCGSRWRSRPGGGSALPLDCVASRAGLARRGWCRARREEAAVDNWGAASVLGHPWGMVWARHGRGWPCALYHGVCNVGPEPFCPTG